METKQTIDAVKRHLWGWGYHAKGFYKTPGLDYQILVAGEHRVVVLQGQQGMVPDGYVGAWIIDGTVWYKKAGEGKATKRPQDIMPLLKKQKSRTNSSN